MQTRTMKKKHGRNLQSGKVKPKPSAICKSSWKKNNYLNKTSIGIEIHNSGHDYIYENFSAKQINSLKKLLRKLVEIYKIDKKNIKLKQTLY